MSNKIVSVFSVQGPPVPIPNTVVKLYYADNTCLETDREDRSTLTSIGVFSAQGPPVPIPNTVVKLCYADNTCLETDREDRSTPIQIAERKFRNKYSSLAQSVEHSAVNRVVAGSSPAGGANKTTQQGGFLLAPHY